MSDNLTSVRNIYADAPPKATSRFDGVSIKHAPYPSDPRHPIEIHLDGLHTEFGEDMKIIAPYLYALRNEFKALHKVRELNQLLGGD